MSTPPLSRKYTFRYQETADESTADRFEKVKTLFTLDRSFLIDSYKKLKEDVDSYISTGASKNGLEFIDTGIESLSKLSPNSVFYAFELSGTFFECSRIFINSTRDLVVDKKRVTIDELGRDLPFPKKLRDKKVTATQMFNLFAETTKGFYDKYNDADKLGLDKILGGFSLNFPFIPLKMGGGILKTWGKTFQTGRGTNDPVENGADLSELMNEALKRYDVPLFICKVTNDCVASLIAQMYYSSKHRRPRCSMSIVAGTGLNLCYFERFHKTVTSTNPLNTECGNYTGFVQNLIDMQVDMSDPSPGSKLAEKMVSGAFLHELCRRSLLRIFRSDCPELLWANDSLSLEACLAVAYQDDEDHTYAKLMCSKMLDWELEDSEQLKFIGSIFRVIFERSAQLLACLVCVFAERTGRLQPAVGGLTISVSGVLLNNKSYRRAVYQTMETLVGKKTAELVIFETSDVSTPSGIAILMNHIAQHYSENIFNIF